jgi:uncharacterized membrane protein
MNLPFKKEIFYWLLCLIPFLFLAYIYGSLPGTVPTHFSIDGTANGWSSKQSLWFMPAGLPLFIYLLFLIIPKIDPKQRFNKASGKYEQLRFILLLFMTGLACFTIYISYKQSMAHVGKFMFAALGLLFAALGNFFPALKPNYFIGIRSPWTLENETVWKKTHKLGGKIWVVCGIVLAALPFIIKDEMLMNEIFLPTVLAMAIFPVLYSFIIWKQLKKKQTI